MKLNDIRLSLANINRREKDSTCECIGVSFLKDIKDPDVVKGYKFECAGVRGSTFDIKTDNSEENKEVFDKIEKILKKEEDVKIIAEELTVKAYALINEKGNLLSGISAKADSISIVDDKPIDY